MTVTNAYIDSCQMCLLERGGATHIQWVEVLSEKINIYYVVGPQDYFKANLIRCFDKNLCNGLKVKDSELQLFSDGICGTSSTATFSDKHIEKYTGNGQQDWVGSAGLPRIHQPNLAHDIDRAGQPSIGRSKEEPKHLCIFREDATFSFLCEACIKANSDFGSMEKYFMYRGKASVFYAIHSSDSGDSIKSCFKTKICHGTTALLSHGLCNLFKYQISTKAKQDREMPQLTGTFLDNIRLFTTPDNAIQRGEAIKTKLLTLMFNSYCLSSTKAYFANEGCWGCLAKAYNGMVILDTVQVRPGKPITFILSLFTMTEPNPKDTVCQSMCGHVKSSEDCTFSNGHVSNRGFANNIFSWMKRIPAGQNKDDVSHECLLADHTNENKPGCRQCFEHGETSKLSQFSFLMALKVDAEAAKKLECFFHANSDCKDLQVMPDIMCHYEANSLKADLDLNQRPKEEKSELPAGSSSEARNGKAAMVTVVKWKKYASNDASEKAAFTECYICLARYHKVVLISVEKRYVWMVDSELHPNCKECVAKVKYGPKFPYNRYIRQIQVLDVEGSPRNPRKRKHGSAKQKSVREIQEHRLGD